MEILLFLIGSVGLTHIVVDGSIFEWLRNFLQTYSPNFFGKLIACYTCLGFWFGILSGWLCFENISYGQLFVAGGAASFLSSLAAVFLNYLEARTIVSLGDDDDK
jgi:hypothetical protein